MKWTLLWVLSILFVLWGWLGLESTFAASLPYKLRMLGYSDNEISAIVSGEKCKTRVDQEEKLRMLGYSPDMVSDLLSRSHFFCSYCRDRRHHLCNYASLVHRIAIRAGIDPYLVMAVIQVESDFNPRAVSPSGAAGLMQLMPKTALELGVTDPFDPVQNITAGTRYLAQCFHRFNDVHLALAAYNAGPNRVAKTNAVPQIPQTQRFIRRVMDYKKRFETKTVK